MLIRSLEAFGVPSRLLQVWESHLGPELLPIQQEAVTRYGVLAGANLIVQAPTSAGKTFIGEMAASRAALAGQRVLYLAPTRALAEEKFAHFDRAYGSLGLRVAVSTRDRRSDDQRLLRGDYDLGVVVPEKLRSLWVRSGAGLAGLGLVVVDELQMLADAQRGPCLEVLLAELRQMPGVQIIGLSACLGTSPRLAEYLHAGWLESTWRPVELRRGVLSGDTFEYREHNSGRLATEEFAGAGVCPGDSYADAATRLAAFLARRGESTLVFTRDRGAVVALAWRLARALTPDREAPWEGGEETGQSVVQRQLDRLMPSGVAFHSADLLFDDRQRVEAAFRAGQIQVVCATPTLALGVNLPAQNVIIDPWSWQCEDRGGPAMLRPISAGEYENRAGRAGRLGHSEFGRAILLADSPLAQVSLWQRYVEGTPELAEPALSHMEATDAAVQLAAVADSRHARDIQSAYTRTFTAYWAGDAVLPARLASGLSECERQGLLRSEAGGRRLVPTALGRVVAAAGISHHTFVWLKQWVEGEALTNLEATYVALLSCEAMAEWAPPFHLSQTVDYGAQLRALAAQLGEGTGVLAQALATGIRSRALRQEAARQALVLQRWVGDEATALLEEELRTTAARLATLGETTGWLVETLAAIGAEQGWSPSDCDRLRQHAERLALGLPAAGVALGRLRLPGLSRDQIRRLVAEGVRSPREAAQAPAEWLASLVGPVVADRLRRAGGAIAAASPPAGRPAPSLTDRGGPGLARTPAVATEPVLVLDEGRPDEAVFCGQRVDLRPAEYRLLRALAEAPGKCVRYDTLYNRLWNGDRFVEPGQIYSHRSRLCAKLAKAVPDRDVRRILVTVPRHGLRLDLSPEEVLIAS
ncbi:MAG: DEAD/DEAH box helicase [Armatimonadetes bacterium]|nr:DEAD/DEAH box helicase [Armatimonadota bacterium]